LVGVASPPILEGRSEMPANAPKVLLRSEQSGGVLSVIELTFHVDGELFTRRADEVAFAPRGVPHLRHQTDDLERRQR
jgi:hypothetical protein